MKDQSVNFFFNFSRQILQRNTLASLSLSLALQRASRCCSCTWPYRRYGSCLSVVRLFPPLSLSLSLSLSLFHSLLVPVRATLATAIKRCESLVSKKINRKRPSSLFGSVATAAPLCPDLGRLGARREGREREEEKEGTVSPTLFFARARSLRYFILSSIYPFVAWRN